MDQSSFSQNRRSRRAPVFLAASVEVAGTPEPVKLRNLSEEGALIEGERLPLEGTTTFFQRNELRLKSRVVWVQGRFAGVAFARALKAEEVLRNVPKPRQQIQADFRRPGLACRPLTPEERQMVEKWMVSSPTGALGESSARGAPELALIAKPSDEPWKRDQPIEGDPDRSRIIPAHHAFERRMSVKANRHICARRYFRSAFDLHAALRNVQRPRAVHR